MDWRLKDQKTQRRRWIYGRTKPGYLLKHHIPVKTDRWEVTSPGFTEVIHLWSVPHTQTTYPGNR